MYTNKFAFLLVSHSKYLHISEECLLHSSFCYVCAVITKIGVTLIFCQFALLVILFGRHFYNRIKWYLLIRVQNKYSKNCYLIARQQLELFLFASATTICRLWEKPNYNFQKHILSRRSTNFITLPNKLQIEVPNVWKRFSINNFTTPCRQH